jgi:outer membrane protein OmpA-like peptidoglycan-associated protein
MDAVSLLALSLLGSTRTKQTFMNRIIISLLTLSVLATGCSSTRKMSNQDKGVAIGAGSGAVLGGIIGRAAGNTGLGAIIGAGVGGVTGGVIGHRMDKQAEEIKQEVPGVKVERVGEGIVVEFSESVLFGFNQKDLNAQSYRSLDKLVMVLNKYQDTNLEIDGHTDSKGTDTYNQTLSEQRASAVAQYLIGHNISGSRVKHLGYGERYPKYSNDTESGRGGNRRVEFQITANERMKQDVAREASNG